MGQMHAHTSLALRGGSAQQKYDRITWEIMTRYATTSDTHEYSINIMLDVPLARRRVEADTESPCGVGMMKVAGILTW